MTKIKLKILDQEMDIEKARDLYLELKELFDKQIEMVPYCIPIYVEPWKPYLIITYDVPYFETFSATCEVAP